MLVKLSPLNATVIDTEVAPLVAAIEAAFPDVEVRVEVMRTAVSDLPTDWRILSVPAKSLAHVEIFVRGFNAGRCAS